MNHHTKMGLTIFITVSLFLIALIFELFFHRGKRFLAVLICSTMALVMILTINYAVGRDDGRYANSVLKPWFDQLKSRNGLCCSDADGWALSGVDWESRSGKYRVRIPKTRWLPTKEQREPPPEVELVWFDVPDDAVITEPNRAGRAMVWPAYGYWGIKIVCFMPGPMT